MRVLEVSSGCGTHCTHFVKQLPKNVVWQPTEFDLAMLPNISAMTKEAESELKGKILEPIFLDITDSSSWSQIAPMSFDFMFNSNLVHISPWKCAVGLFEASGSLLKPRGRLFRYGPYAVNGELTPESNVNFDRYLRGQNSEWGVRDIADLTKEATKNGLSLEATREMPANNKVLVWKKCD